MSTAFLLILGLVMFETKVRIVNKHNQAEPLDAHSILPKMCQCLQRIVSEWFVHCGGVGACWPPPLNATFRVQPRTGASKT